MTATHRGPADVTVAELAVLDLLWQRDWATIRELTDELYPRGTASNFSTVQKLLERLKQKRFVARQGQKGAVQFQASVDRDELIYALSVSPTAPSWQAYAARAP